VSTPSNLADATAGQIAAAVRKALSRAGVGVEDQLREVMAIIEPVMRAKDARAVLGARYNMPPAEVRTVLDALADAAQCGAEHAGVGQVSLEARHYRRRVAVAATGGIAGLAILVAGVVIARKAKC
jgi:hypothetical protein